MGVNKEAFAEVHQARTSKIFDKETRQEILRKVSEKMEASEIEMEETLSKR